MYGKFFFVGTPIGNLDDITLRALNTLRLADVIACEDTRHSQILLMHYDIKKPTKSYHKFNERKACQELINLLKTGKNIALISDAGMPLISDPGAIILKELITEDIEYEIIPGVSAVITALAGSGLDCTKFSFLGFLPAQNVDKNKLLDEYRYVTGTLVLYSACHDINGDLKFLYNALGKRKVCIAHELTKKFEKYIRGNLEDILIDDPKGEYVILVEGAENACPLVSKTPQEHLQFYLDQGENKMDAVKKVAKERGVKKNDIYKLLIDRDENQTC